MTQQINKRIAKNTVILYCRLLITMVFSLYTSRVVLNALGIEDFGIYNIVAGVIIMFGFLNSAMTASTQRFLTFELGRGDLISLRKVFNASLTIHYIIALIVLILAETVGLWCLNSYLVIPSNRINAANWVYQFSVFSFLFNIISVPYTSSIIANEKMNLFAYVSLLEVGLKLLAVLMLVWFSYDKLIFYGFLLFVISIIVRVADRTICKRNFEECKENSLLVDREIFYKMGNFAGWNMFGVAAGVGYNQGVNVLLNIFFGAAMNATRGIAFQVQGAVSNLVTSFQMASGPMITKYYSLEDNQNAFLLVIRTSKFSFYLLLLVAIPLLIKTKIILILWLKVLPEFTVIFTQLVILDVLINSLSGPLQILVQATGNVKKYQLYVSGLLLLNLPTSYFFLKLGFSPQFTLIISIFYSILALFLRLFILKRDLKFPVFVYFKSVLIRSLIVGGVSYSLLILANKYLNDSFLSVVIFTIETLVVVGSMVVLFGLNRNEFLFLKDKITKSTV